MNFQKSLEHGKKLGIDIIAPWYNILLLQLFPKDLEYGLLEAYSKRREYMHVKIRETIKEQSNVYLYEQAGGILCFIEKGNSAKDLQEREREGVTALQDFMEDYEDVKYFLAIGKPVDRIRDMGMSYNAASRAFAERYLRDDSTVFYYNQEESGRESVKKETIDYRKLDIGKIEQKYMMNFLRNGSAAEVQDFVEDYFESMGAEAISSLLLRQYAVMGAIVCMISFLSSISISGEEIDQRLGNFQDAPQSVKTMEEAKAYMEKLLTEAISARNRAADKKYTKIIDEAQVFIQENYNKEDISLHSVASNVNVSPNHFSMVFKQETGETFIEYLTKVRMDKAKEMLVCTSMKTSEIGFEVGYRDPHYFSYIFKKIQGMSPKEYRKSHRELEQAEKGS